MKRFFLLLFAFLLALAVAARGMATEVLSDFLPVGAYGTLVVFNTDGLRCVLYVNEGGMAKGSGAAQCVPLNPNVPLPDSADFQILRVVRTQSSR